MQLILDILDTPDIVGIVLDNLNFQAVRKLSTVSKVINQSRDWRALLDSKVVRFVSGKKYISTPGGGCNRINVYTVTRKTVGSKTVLLDGRRMKVRRYRGAEYVNIGPKWAGMNTTQAVNVHSESMDAKIQLNNSYPYLGGNERRIRVYRDIFCIFDSGNV